MTIFVVWAVDLGIPSDTALSASSPRAHPLRCPSYSSSTSGPCCRLGFGGIYHHQLPRPNLAGSIDVSRGSRLLLHHRPRPRQIQRKSSSPASFSSDLAHLIVVGSSSPKPVLLSSVFTRSIVVLFSTKFTQIWSDLAQATSSCLATNRR